MTVAEFTALVKAVSELVGAVIWPAVVLFILWRFSGPLSDFFSSLGEFSFKAPGMEATAKRKQVVHVFRNRAIDPDVLSDHGKASFGIGVKSCNLCGGSAFIGHEHGFGRGERCNEAGAFGYPRIVNQLVVRGYSQGGQNDDERDNDDQLGDREAPLGRKPRFWGWDKAPGPWSTHPQPHINYRP